jgi:IMP dehydrogenase
MIINEALCFDDVLLTPKYSEIESRSKVDVSIQSLGLSHPIIPANMKTITGIEMASEIISSGGLAILHRFMPFEEQMEIVRKLMKDNTSNVNKQLSVSIGAKENDREYVVKFYSAGIRIFNIDVAHGHSKQCIEMTKWIRNSFKDIFIISGNVATGEGANALWTAGADAIRVGVGNGSICTTRIETGNGVPQLSALIDVAETRDYHIKNKFITKPIYIISDGGANSAGDLVKALCFADLVMTGNLFAGCEETPGEKIEIDGISYKRYVGSSTHKNNHIEGVQAMVHQKGPYKQVLTKLLEGIRSGMSYQGARSLEELRKDPKFVRMTSAGLRESHAHNVIVK